MISTRRSLNFTAPLVLDPPSHSGVFSVALVPGRHLIGSAADCDICLNFAGIASRHVIVMVGENRTIVKSMDSRTWVNDSPVTEMALRAGDRLSVGPVTFRVRAATKDEIADFGPPESDGQVHRLDIPDATIADHVADTLSAPAEASDTQRQVPATDALFAVIEASPLSATAIDHRTDSVAAEQPNSLDSFDHRASDSLDDRLGEIQQRLAELELGTSPARHADEPPTVDTNLWARSLQAREHDLLRRVEKVAVDSEHLQERAAQLATRESHLDARQQQLGLEAKRIADIAESTRGSLAEQHAEHLAIWKDWEAAYQRMAADMASQTDAVNQQRESLLAEADRLSVARTALQRAQTVHEQDRKNYGSDQALLANERAEVLTLRNRFEAQRQQHQLEVAEQRRQIDAAKREWDLRRAELDTSLQQLDQERQLVLADRSEQVRRVEQDNQRRTSLYSQLEVDRERLRVEREEFALAQVGFEQRRTAFERDFTLSESVRNQAAIASSERDHLADRCRQLEIELATQIVAKPIVALDDGLSSSAEDSAPLDTPRVELVHLASPQVLLPVLTEDPIVGEMIAAEAGHQRYDTFDAWSVPIKSSVLANEALTTPVPTLPPLPPVEAGSAVREFESLPAIESTLSGLDEQKAFASEEACSNTEPVPRLEEPNIWGELTVFEQGPRREVPPPVPPVAEFASSPTGIDPWGSFVPTPAGPIDNSPTSATSRSIAEIPQSN